MLLHLQNNVGFIQLFVLQVVQDLKTQANESKSAFLFVSNPTQNTRWSHTAYYISNIRHDELERDNTLINEVIQYKQWKWDVDFVNR